MANFHSYSTDTTLRIPRVITVDSVNYYEILIKSGPVKWSVNRRYRDFDELHEKLMQERSVPKEWLPPKKVIGNKSPAFIKKRQEALERYLRDVFVFLQLTMPKEFVEFLEFSRYDIIFLVQTLANSFFLRGETFLAKSKKYGFSVLELHAISERLKIPCPTYETADSTFNFSHILDFCSQLETVIILPTKNSLPTFLYDDESEKYIPQTLNKPIGTSNLVPSKLNFELSVFKW